MAMDSYGPPPPYQRLEPHTKDDPRAIFLYTAPLRVSSKLFGVKKGHDLINHWAVCVGGYCYEMARNVEEKKEDKTEDKKDKKDKKKDKKAPKHHVKVSREDDWKARKDSQKRNHEKSPVVGYTAAMFSKETLEYIGEYITYPNAYVNG